VKTVTIQVRPLGGNSFSVDVQSSNATVGETKAGVCLGTGTDVARQDLYRVAFRADGVAVREDDAEPELLADDSLCLGDGDAVVLAVKEAPIYWRSVPGSFMFHFDEVVEHTHRRQPWPLPYDDRSNHRGAPLEWEVLLAAWLTPGLRDHLQIGVCRRNLHWGWFTGDDEAGSYKTGDRVGVLLNLGTGSLRFFKNGEPFGPVYTGVSGPVLRAVQTSAGVVLVEVPDPGSDIRWHGAR
jgi:hypothetical protein